MAQRTNKNKIGVSISPNLKREAEEIMEADGISTLTKRNGVAEDWSGVQDMIRSMIEDVLKGKD